MGEWHVELEDWVFCVPVFPVGGCSQGHVGPKGLSPRPVCDGQERHMQGTPELNSAASTCGPKCAQLFQAASPAQPFLGLTHLEEHVVTRGPPLCSFECSAEAPSISKKSSNTRFFVGSSSHHHQNCCVQNADSRSRDKLLDPDLREIPKHKVQEPLPVQLKLQHPTRV